MNGTEEIIAKIDKLDQYAQKYSAQTAAQKQIAEYGAKNIIMLVQDYHGRYEDDDCYFTYFNNVTGEIFFDSWTTRFGCPNFFNYASLTAYEALMVGVEINPKLRDILLSFLEKQVDSCIDEIYTYLRCGDYKPQIGRKVKVERGNKFRGEGYLMSITEKSYNLGWKVRYSYNALIYNPVTDSIEEANSNWVYYADIDLFKEEYMQWFKERISDQDISALIPNLGTGDFEIFKTYHPCKFLDTYMQNHPIPQKAFDAFQRRTDEKREIKRKELNKWVSRFTDKTPEEREFMVERALKKQGF